MLGGTFLVYAAAAIVAADTDDDDNDTDGNGVDILASIVDVDDAFK